MDRFDERLTPGRDGVDRRAFLKTAAGAALLGASSSLLLPSRKSLAAPSPQSAAETAVGRFYHSLSEAQRAKVAFPFEHDLRQKINANWHITEPTIGDEFYSNDQRQMIDEIVKNVMSPEGYEQVKRQTEADDGGMGAYSVAVFGEPGSGKFQWELTGRHLTMRADGDSVDRAAFGGPIIYGHGEEDIKANLYYYQTKQVNEVFGALDAKQMELALLQKAPSESAVQIQGAGKAYPGLAVSELSSDQRELVEKSLKVLLAPYRGEDVDEVMSIPQANGGLEQFHLPFYRDEDLDNDKVWDIWRVEGPAFVWHFRGAPHVHAYINIGQVVS